MLSCSKIQWVVKLYADLSTLNEVCDSFENVCHLSHHPESFLEQKHQLFVLCGAGALLIGRHVVVVGQGLLVALDGDWVIFALEPPTKIKKFDRHFYFFSSIVPIYVYINSSIQCFSFSYNSTPLFLFSLNSFQPTEAN